MDESVNGIGEISLKSSYIELLVYKNAQRNEEVSTAL